MIGAIKSFLWKIFAYWRITRPYRQTHSIRDSLRILTSEKTIKAILQNHMSVVRFGDGEFQIMDHYLSKLSTDSFMVDSFQEYDQHLGQRLVEVYTTKQSNILICLPYPFKNSGNIRWGARLFWEREWLGRMTMLLRLGVNRTVYGDTNFTRFYMDRRDIASHFKYTALLKEIWEQRPVVIVEGMNSRLGIGNDLFANVATVERVLCPAKNAFRCYERILETISRMDKDKLILIALGQSATVLAHDLTSLGYQALDIGHVDIEYEWYIARARKKISIPNKYVNEVGSGRVQTELNDSVYQSQIKCFIR